LPSNAGLEPTGPAVRRGPPIRAGGDLNLSYFNEAAKGGHFAVWEQPELFATEIRAAVRSLR
jgi:hypothetical protein